MANRRRGRSRKPPRQGLAAFRAEAASGGAAAGADGGLRVLKLFAGIALLPLCWALLETFLVLLRADTFGGSHWRSREFAYFAAGALLWTGLFFGFRARILVWLYVAGHELTHALFVLVCKGRVSEIHISSRGGHILTDRNNFLISLSPYFFPFYTVLLIAAWAVAGWVFGEGRLPPGEWLHGAIGFTWMFHFTFTVWMIRRDQPDVLQNGRIFSFSVIFPVNVLLISALLIVASPTASFRGFAVSLWENLRTLPFRFFESAAEVWSALPL